MIRIETKGKLTACLKQEAENLDNNITELTKKSQRLSEKIEKGKKLGVGVLIQRGLRPIEKRLDNWKITTEKDMINEYATMLKEKQAAFQRLQEIHSELEEQNNKLLLENEELRHASMDGLEIANVFIIMITSFRWYRK